MNTQRTLLVSAVLAATACTSATSLAQARLEEVVVTAQKRAQSITDVGITINAFSRETLDDLGVDTVTDIAAHTPGLIFNEAGGLGRTGAVRDGDHVRADAEICIIRGPARAILTGERSALNFVQFLSATATL